MRELIHPGQFAGHKAVVVGAARSGLAAVRLLSALGASVALADSRGPGEEARGLCADLGVEVVAGEHRPEHFAAADLVVLSPGVNIHKLAPALADVPERKIVGELELASWFVSEPMAAVTGTSGKTTTAGLLAAMCEAAGKKVFLGGNIGTPLSEYLLSGERAELLVLEVSSFQLATARSFAPHVGVWTSFAPNHLDWHESLEEYFAAKLSMFERMSAGDLAVVPLTLREAIEPKNLAVKRIYFVAAGRFENPRLVGEHNQANMEAAWLAAKALGVGEADAARGAAAYEPQPHRLETFLTVGGVRFVDDSKATTLDALEAALNAFDAPVLLVAGGIFKGGDAAALAPLIRKKVKAVCGCGASREVFEAAWASAADFDWKPTMAEAVAALWQKAEPGDVILLSPATSSFDAYENYKSRGEDFKRAAREAAC